MMMSNFASLVVLFVIVSKHVIISDKNGTTLFKDEFHQYSGNESKQRNYFTDGPQSTLSKIDDIGIIPTTYRSIRFNNYSSSTHERDTKLMNLLAARRSALHTNRFRTHRRVVVTDQTRAPVETTSKSPLDFRTTCVHNCTKNFTRRTTAGCMRKCTINQRATYSTTTINYNSKEEKSQKDNNEILLTDESSHGFFVVAKDANDTVNHISNLRKVTDLSFGTSSKIKSRGKHNTSISTETSELFERRSPSLRPSLLSISSVSNDHPQVLEISVSQSPFRSKTPSKFNTRQRGMSTLYRKLNVGKLTSLSESTIKPTMQATTLEGKRAFSSNTFNVSEIESAILEKELISIESLIPGEVVEEHVPSKLEEKIRTSTPLIITVIGSDDSTSKPEFLSSDATEINKEDWSTEILKENVPLQFSDDKTNLVIFVNKSTEIVTPTPTVDPRGYKNYANASENVTVIKTTVFSSVRSTIHPPQAGILTLASSNDISGVLEQNKSTIKTKEKDELVLDMRRLNIATYVLTGLGIFPILTVILYLGRAFIHKKYKSHDEDFDVCITDQQPISPVKKRNKDADIESTRNEPYSISSIDEFNRANLRLKSLLGEGNFGQVWKAEADDLSGHIGATRIVAVKTVRSGGAQESLRDEAMIMKKLGSHPNVVTLLGACIESEPHMIIMEFAMRGRLLSLLRAVRSATNVLPASVPGGKSLAPLSPRTLAGFALDIATGMEYISEKKIVHRDLAARNVLIDHNGICKICDFGMSLDLDIEYRKDQIKENFAYNNSSKLNKFKFDFEELFNNNWNHGFSIHHVKKQHDILGRRPALPIRWMAPESLQYNKFSTKSDIWAFGIVLWEIATLGATPYSNLSGREVVRHVLQGTRPDIPKDGLHGFFNLMVKCWQKPPELRPTFSEARLEISRFVCKWIDDEEVSSDYMDVSGFSEDLEHGMVYFNQRISEFECDI